MKKVILILTLLTLVFDAHANKSNTDSLKNIISSSKADSLKIKALIVLTDYLPEYNPDSGIYFSKQLIDLGQKNKDVHAEAYGLAALSYSYYNKGNYPTALQYQIKSLGLIEEGNDKVSIADFYNNLGNIYKGQMYYTQAIIYYQKCYRLALSIHDSIRLFYAMMNLGYVYEQTNVLDSSLLYSKKGLELGLKLQYNDENSYILGNLGNLYAKTSDGGNMALSYYKRSLELASHYPKGLAMTNIYLAKYYKTNQNYDSAIFYAKKGIIAAREVSYLKAIFEGSDILSNIYSKKNQVDSAYVYLKLNTATKDSLYNKEKAQDIENLTLNEKMHEKELLEKSEKAERERIKNLQMVGIALFIPIFFLLSLLVSKTKVSNRVVDYMGMLSVLLLFDFIGLLIGPYKSNITNHFPVFDILLSISIGLILSRYTI